jgi:hypothetical protein
VSSGDSVRIGIGTGAIGKYGDSLFNDIPGAWPIIPSAAGGDPIGYALPDGNLSCRLTSVTYDYAHFTVFTDSIVMAYRRDGVGPNETEQVDIRGGEKMYLINPDGLGRVCDIDLVVVQSDRERLIALGDLQLAASDSAGLELTPEAGLRVANYGAAATYDLIMRDLGDGILKEFEHAGITVGANSEQELVPNWGNIGEAELMVIIDDGIDGVADDTIYISNNSPLDADDEQGGILPYRFELAQNYPNPFNPSTRIEYSLPERSHVTISVYNVLGQLVCTLVDREQSAGWYEAIWDGTTASGEPVASGVYLYRFQAGDHVQTKKMLLLK